MLINDNRIIQVKITEQDLCLDQKQIDLLTQLIGFYVKKLHQKGLMTSIQFYKVTNLDRQTVIQYEIILGNEFVPLPECDLNKLSFQNVCTGFHKVYEYLTKELLLQAPTRFDCESIFINESSRSLALLDLHQYYPSRSFISQYDLQLPKIG